MDSRTGGVGRGKAGIERLVDAAGDRHDGRKVSRGARALEGRGSGADDDALKRVALGHHETAEALAVLVLHGQHPLEVPADFVEEIRRRVRRLGNVERHVTNPLAKQLVGPEQCARGDSRIDDARTSYGMIELLASSFQPPESRIASRESRLYTMRR